MLSAWIAAAVFEHGEDLRLVAVRGRQDRFAVVVQHLSGANISLGSMPMNSPERSLHVYRDPGKL